MGQHLKRVKKQNALKAKLYYEIGDFLIELKLASTPDHRRELREILSKGWRGLHESSNKDLVGTLEQGMLDLKDPKFRIEWNDDQYRNRYKSSEESNEIRKSYIQKGNELMDKLMERALGLEAEDEEVKRSKTGKVNKRRLVDDITDPTRGDF